MIWDAVILCDVTVTSTTQIVPYLPKWGNALEQNQEDDNPTEKK